MKKHRVVALTLVCIATMLGTVLSVPARSYAKPTVAKWTFMILLKNREGGILEANRLQGVTACRCKRLLPERYQRRHGA